MKKVLLFFFLGICIVSFYLLRTDKHEDLYYEDNFEEYEDGVDWIEEELWGEPEKIILNTYSFDLNSDGQLDKINLFQNNEGEYDFDRKHFNLSIEILKGSKNGFTKWTNSNSIIFNSQNTCIAEGFESIVFKDDSLIIQQYGCYDYNVSVSSTATFKVSDDQIFLHEYNETYFNKADHNQEIPDKSWAEIDFGKVKFEDVSEDFFTHLRNENINKEIECSNLFETYFEKSDKILFIGCEKSDEPQSVLEARYSVSGKDIKKVEAMLANKYGMEKLDFGCCGWDSTMYIENKELQTMNPNYVLEISMYGNAEKVNKIGEVIIETDKTKIDFFITVKILEV